MRSLRFGISNPCGTTLPNSERFAAWISDSWASASQTYLLDNTAHIWMISTLKKTDFWASAYRPTFLMALLLSESFGDWKRDYGEAPNGPPYRTALHIYWRIAALKCDSWEVLYGPPYRTALPIYWQIAALKRDSWESEYQPPCLTALPIPERFAP